MSQSEFRLTNIKIRSLIEDDLEGSDFFKTLSVFKDFELSEDKAREVFQDCQRRGIETYVAFSDNRVVGAIRLLFEAKYYHKGRLAAHIEDVATHPDYQGQGIASALIEYALGIVKEKQCYKVILDCEEKLIPFYSRFGFKEFSRALRLDY